MLKKISFSDYQHDIVRLRREAFNSLVHEVDEFDAAAHHFALFDAKQQMTGTIRVLRSDEVPRLELQSESDARGLLLPQNGLIIEVSRGCAGKSITGMPMIQMAWAIKEYARKEKALHIVSKTSPKLLPLYMSMGFRVFGKPFHSDWFYDRETGDTSVPIIYDVVKSTRAVAVPQPQHEEEEVLVW
jgi:predicted GNAT family N-acyltransferase